MYTSLHLSWFHVIFSLPSEIYFNNRFVKTNPSVKITSPFSIVLYVALLLYLRLSKYFILYFSVIGCVCKQQQRGYDPSNTATTGAQSRRREGMFHSSEGIRPV